VNLTPVQTLPIPLRGDALSQWYATWLCPRHLHDHYRAIGDWAQNRVEITHTTAALHALDGVRHRPFVRAVAAPTHWHPHLFSRPLSWRPTPDFRNPRRLRVPPALPPQRHA
jgi:hypothetical protein